MYLKMDTHKVTRTLPLTAIVLSGELKCCARHEVTAAKIAAHIPPLQTGQVCKWTATPALSPREALKGTSLSAPVNLMQLI